jgi:hypothetical protein
MNDRSRNHQQKWTAQEDAFLRQHIPSLTPSQCSSHMGRTVDAVKNRARVLGLKWRDIPPHPDRFWMRVRKTATCWEWTGHISADGYGRYRLGGRFLQAHRIAYELIVAPIPSGLTLDHLCRNRRCVNPDHMDPVTHRVNILRGISPSAFNSTRTHCIHGHPFDQANTAISKRGYRICRECGRIRLRERRRQQRDDRRAA